VRGACGREEPAAVSIGLDVEVPAGRAGFVDAEGTGPGDPGEPFRIVEGVFVATVLTIGLARSCTVAASVPVWTPAIAVAAETTDSPVVEIGEEGVTGATGALTWGGVDGTIGTAGARPRTD
jgi:hypothetical protein